MRKTIGNLELYIEMDRGEANVSAEIAGNLSNMCWIVSEEIEEFIDELNAVINKYRI